MLGLALSRNERNELKVSFGIINFLSSDEIPGDDQKYDYGNFIVIKNFLEVESIITILRSIIEKQVLPLADQELPLKISISPPHFYPSSSRFNSEQWPFIFISSSIDSSTTQHISYDSLSKLGLPLFPNGNEAIVKLLGIDPPYSNSREFNTQFEIRIPDFRGRIKSLRLTGNKITVEAQTKVISVSDLRVKLYCRTEDDSVFTSEDISLQDNQASFVTGKEPSIIEAHILSAVDGESLDWISIDYRYPSRQEGVVIENNEAQLLDIIRKGENETVEFKQELDDKIHSKEFLETVVAFANSKGGRIFMGVSDNCNIVGFREDSKAKISDLIDGNCEPSIKAQVQEVKLGNLPITIVEVPEGENKPYLLNNKGVFVRRGSSDRQAKRSELDEIYMHRGSTIGY